MVVLITNLFPNVKRSGSYCNRYRVWAITATWCRNHILRDKSSYSDFYVHFMMAQQFLCKPLFRPDMETDGTVSIFKRIEVAKNCSKIKRANPMYQYRSYMIRFGHVLLITYSIHRNACCCSTLVGYQY